VQRYVLQLFAEAGKPRWRTHANYDVAVLAVNISMLRAEGAEFSFIAEDKSVLYINQMIEEGVFAGDDIYVIGFPMGLAGTQRRYALVRDGNVARLDEEDW
jgi:hypothetical protein